MLIQNNQEHNKFRSFFWVRPSESAIVLKEDKSAFENQFQTQSIESIINELGELIHMKTGENLNIMWDALIKDTNTTFARTHGSISEGSSSTGVVGGNWKNIPLDGAEKVFEFVLKKMGREIKPQLNDQFKFV